MDIMKIMLFVIYIISLYFAVFWFLVFIDGGFNDKRKKMKRFPFVSVCIPAYNAVKNGLEKTIISALNLDYPKEKLEIIVVNHGSTDNIQKVLDKFKGKIKQIHIERKQGEMKGVALNAALKAAKGEYFVTFDADSYVDNDALKKLLAHFTSPEIAAVLPIMKVGEKKTFLQKLQWYEFLINMFYKKVMSKLNCVPVTPGPFSVFKTAYLRKVGGYDGYDLVDDFEMTLKLHKAHYKIIQTNDCSVYSKLPGTVKKVYNQRNRWFLGTLYNLKKYKSLIFNRKYGDFGMMQMPMIAISAVLGTFMVINFTYYALKPHIKNFINLSKINFDIMTLLRNFKINFNILDLNYVNATIMIVMCFITVMAFYFAHKHTKEKPLKGSFFTLPVFFLFYFLLLGIGWMGALFDAIRGKKRGW